jgi:hypothetical protein
VFDWPADGNLHVPAFGKSVKRGYLLASPETALKAVESSEGLVLQLPAAPPDPIATVVVLETRD